MPTEISPTNYTWAEVKANPEYAAMPLLEKLSVKNNQIAKQGFKLSEIAAKSVRFDTLPKSMLSGPLTYASADDLLAFNGHIELDEGCNKKIYGLSIYSEARAIIYSITIVSKASASV